MDNNLDLKRKLLDMFVWFHQFCEQNGLRYYMLGGTMLGAVRHQGFIPWDDDIDVGMPRSDYQRLEMLLKDQTGRYILETPNTSNLDYYYPFSKLYDTETTLIENTRYKIRRGIYLDIFPLDGAGNTMEEGLETFRKVKRKRLLLLTMTAGIRPGRRFLKNAAVIMIRLIPTRLLNPKKRLLSLDRTCAQKKYEESAFVANFVGSRMEREVISRSFFENSRLYVFENMYFYGPDDYDGYLSFAYGDWRTIPPKEKQNSHHDFLYMDLKNSYLNKNCVSR